MDLYDILKVGKNASADDIKKAFRKLSLKHHPDRGGNEEEFKKINQAFQVLGDPEKKRNYDMSKRNPFMQQKTNIFDNNSHGNDPMGGMAGMPDIFKMFFNGMPMNFEDMQHGSPNIRIFRNGEPVFQNHRVKPPPITKTLEISLEDAYEGVVKPLDIEKWIIHNNVKKVENETLYVEVPSGIDNNENIIMKGKGNVNTHGIQGDIKISVRIKNESIFVRQGLDLIVKKNITLKEALIGFKFEIKHLNRKTYVINNFDSKVVTPNFKTVIDKMGMKRGEKTGRLILLFEIEFPKTLSAEQKEQLKNIL